MKTEIKQPTDGQLLRDWLNSVPYGEYNAVRARMVAECMVSKQIFANWLYGRNYSAKDYDATGRPVSLDES